MAGTSINLLPVKKETSQQQQYLAKLGLGIGIVVIIYIAIVAGIFGYGLFLNYQKENVVKKAKDLEVKVATLKKKEYLVLALKTRVSEINKTLGNRKNYSQIIDKLNSLLTEGVSYSSFDFTKDKLVVEAKANNVILAGKYFDAIKKEETFKKVTLNSLSRSKAGAYGFSLEFNFDNEK